MSLPALEPKKRSREFDLYSHKARSLVVQGWLLEGKTTRQLDKEVLGLEAKSSKGWQSMGILHFLGLKRPFQGLFKGQTKDHAIRILEEAGYAHIAQYLKLENIAGISDARESLRPVYQQVPGRGTDPICATIAITDTMLEKSIIDANKSVCDFAKALSFDYGEAEYGEKHSLPATFADASESKVTFYRAKTRGDKRTSITNLKHHAASGDVVMLRSEGDAKPVRVLIADRRCSDFLSGMICGYRAAILRKCSLEIADSILSPNKELANTTGGKL